MELLVLMSAPGIGVAAAFAARRVRRRPWTTLLLAVSAAVAWCSTAVSRSRESGYEAFATVDVLLCLLAIRGVGSVVAARRFDLLVAYLPVPLVRRTTPAAEARLVDRESRTAFEPSDATARRRVA